MQKVIALFLLGLGANLHYQIVGYLAFSEMALVFAAPFVLLTDPSLFRCARLRTMMILLVLWLVSAAFADFWCGVDWPRALRGASRPIFLGAAILMAYKLLRGNPRAAMWFYLGFAISNTISMYAFKSGQIDVDELLYDITISGNFQKQGITIIMAAVPFLLFWKGGRFPIFGGILSFIVGGLSVFLGSRSAGAIMCLTGLVIIAARFWLPLKKGKFRLTMHSAFIGVLVMGLGSFTVLKMYEGAASKGWLGDEAAKKYVDQSQNRFGLIMGGRLEFIAGLMAVADSPLVGHGSWPLDSKGFLLQAAEVANVDVDPSYYMALNSGYYIRMPTHSQILETWVEHGLLAVVFWWYIVWVLIRCSTRGVFVRPDLFAGVVALLLARWWDLLFSPLATRVAVGFSFALFIVLLDLADEADKNAKNERGGALSRIPRLTRLHRSRMAR